MYEVVIELQIYCLINQPQIIQLKTNNQNTCIMIMFCFLSHGFRICGDELVHVIDLLLIHVIDLFRGLYDIEDHKYFNKPMLMQIILFLGMICTSGHDMKNVLKVHFVIHSLIPQFNFSPRKLRFLHKQKPFGT